MELKSRTPNQAQEGTLVHPSVNKVNDYAHDATKKQHEQPYNITKGKEIRENQPPKRYTNANLVSYALSVAKVIAMNESSSYREVITCDEFAQ